MQSFEEFLQELDEYDKNPKVIVSQIQEECKLIEAIAQRDFYKEKCNYLRKVCFELKQLPFYHQKLVRLNRNHIVIAADLIYGLCFSAPLSSFHHTLKGKDSLELTEYNSHENYLFLMGINYIEITLNRIDLYVHIFYL